MSDAELYRRVILPIGHKAKERNDEFAAQYAKVFNRFTQQFTVEFATRTGQLIGTNCSPSTLREAWSRHDSRKQRLGYFVGFDFIGAARFCSRPFPPQRRKSRR